MKLYSYDNTIIVYKVAKVKQITKFLKKIFNGGKTETGAADFFIKKRRSFNKAPAAEIFNYYFLDRKSVV